MRGRPRKYPVSALPTLVSEMLQSLRLDPGTRTLGELLQERQWAVMEIERLGRLVDGGNFQPTAPHRLPAPEARRNDDEASMQVPELLRTKEVCSRFGFAPSTVYRMVKLNGFPKPLQVGGRAVRWRYSEIKAWLEARGRGA